MDYFPDCLETMRHKISPEEKYLDLRGTPCPVNYVRCCLALEDIKVNDLLNVDLDQGEPELTVISGLRGSGFKVEIIYKKSSWLRIKVKRVVH